MRSQLSSQGNESRGFAPALFLPGGGTLFGVPSLLQALSILLLLFALSTSPRRSLSLKLRKTRVYEPQIRARLVTTAHFCEALILKLRAVPVEYNSQCCGLTDCGKCPPHRLRGSAALAGPHRLRVEPLTCAVYGGRCWGSSSLAAQPCQGPFPSTEVPRFLIGEVTM